MIKERGITMKQCTINGIKVSYLPYGDAILIMESINKLGISNGLIIPYNQIKDDVYELHGNKYTIKFMGIQ